MTQIELIKQEIERRITLYKESNYGISLRSDECKELLSFIESLEKGNVGQLGKDGPIVEFVGAPESLEKEPTIKGYVARDEDGTLHFFSSECGDGEPCYDKDYGAWGIATGEMIELPRQFGPFGDLSYRDEPVEVELKIHRV